MVYVESLLFNEAFMTANTLEDVRRYAYDYNNKRNKPPLDHNEVERQIKDAINFVSKKRAERENNKNAVPEEMGLELDNEQIQEICDIIVPWRNKEAGTAVVNAVCSLFNKYGYSRATAISLVESMIDDEEERRYRIASLEEIYGWDKGHKGQVQGETLLQVLTGLVDVEAANEILNKITRVLNKYKNPILELLHDHIRKELQPHIVEVLCYTPLIFVVAHSHKRQILKARIDTKKIENEIRKREVEERVIL